MASIYREGDFIGDDEDPHRYRLIKLLGSGSYGGVWLAERMKDDILVAIKFLSIPRQSLRLVFREILNQQGHKCPQIIKFHEVFRMPIAGYVCIEMEYASGGTVEDFLKVQGGVFHEGLARWFFQQAVSGTAYLHTNDVVMRDIKLPNMVLNEDKSIVKLCDYGFSKHSSDPCTFGGTPAYLAPELIAGHRLTGSPRIPRYDGKAVDVWTLGVCLYVMVYGRYPFDSDDMYSRIENCSLSIPAVQQYEGEYLPVSPGLRQLLKRIFVKNPKARITLPEIINTEWFQEGSPKGGMEALKGYMVKVDKGSMTGVLSWSDVAKKLRICIPEKRPSFLATLFPSLKK